jgi:hypothetical protein
MWVNVCVTRLPDGTPRTGEDVAPATASPPGRQTSPEVAALASHYLRLDSGFLKLPTLDADKVMADIRKLAASALGQVNE